MNEKPTPPMRGERRKTIDGRMVTILEKFGEAYKALNEAGRLVIVYPRQIMDPTNQ